MNARGVLLRAALGFAALPTGALVCAANGAGADYAFNDQFSFHDDPPKLPQEGVDVHGPPFSSSVVNLNRDSLPTSFPTSSVKDHVNIGVTVETLFQRLVHQRNTTRNDKEVFLVHIPIATL
jgi:hypothetical protein